MYFHACAGVCKKIALFGCNFQTLIFVCDGFANSISILNFNRINLLLIVTNYYWVEWYENVVSIAQNSWRLLELVALVI